MKQVKCWVLVGSDGIPVAQNVDKPSNSAMQRDDGFCWIEMTGELPDPGQWAEGDPPREGRWWRWSINSVGGFPCECRWDENKGWSCPGMIVVNPWAPYYWTGDEKPTEAPPEKACEVRWDGSCKTWRWHADPDKVSVGFFSPQIATRSARDCGYRVTNDPRAVVLKEEIPGLWLPWCKETAHSVQMSKETMGLESWRVECARRGWRILREEPAVVTHPADNTCQVIWSDEIHRWEIVIKRNQGDRRGFASLTEALEHADRLKLHVTNWADALQGAKILESEKVAKTCEVKWDGEHWAMVVEGCEMLYHETLRAAQEFCVNKGWHVTNDPRDVVLKEYDYGWQLLELRNGYWSFDSAQCPLQLSDWRERVRTRGWRILREEPAESQHFGGQPGDECGCDRCLGREPRPTAAQLFERWRCKQPPGSEEGLIQLLECIVEVIGRDKR
jgi:hypothetical protein